MKKIKEAGGFLEPKILGRDYENGIGLIRRALSNIRRALSNWIEVGGGSSRAAEMRDAIKDEIDYIVETVFMDYFAENPDFSDEYEQEEENPDETEDVLARESIVKDLKAAIKEGTLSVKEARDLYKSLKEEESGDDDYEGDEDTPASSPV